MTKLWCALSHDLTHLRQHIIMTHCIIIICKSQSTAETKRFPAYIFSAFHKLDDDNDNDNIINNYQRLFVTAEHTHIRYNIISYTYIRYICDAQHHIPRNTTATRDPYRDLYLPQHRRRNIINIIIIIIICAAQIRDEIIEKNII